MRLLARLKIAVVDTTFARVDMAKYVIEEIKRLDPNIEITRITVPGIKDLPGAAKRAISQYNCDGVITLGWVGKEFVDKLSYVATSIGLMIVGIMTDKVIIDVTIHEDESDDPKNLKKIAEDRSRKHARNLVFMLKNPEYLSKFAGRGLRQGYGDVGPIV